MVRALFFVSILSFTVMLWANSDLVPKVESLLDKREFAKHSNLIELIFQNEKAFLTNNRIDVMRVVKELDENGLMKLIFKEPSTLNLTFKTSGSPLLFVKLLSDSLRSLGYYRFLTTGAMQNSDGFVWEMRMDAEYAINPILLNSALLKRGVHIVDLKRISETQWEYLLDSNSGYMDTKALEPKVERVLNKTHSDYWLNVKKGSKLRIWSQVGNSWYPYLSVFDKNLHFLKVYKRDKRTRRLTLQLPEGSVYVRVSDLYQLNNIKEGLKVTLRGEK